MHPVRTSQEAHLVSTTDPNRLMLCEERDAVCCENRMEHNDTLCGQKAGLWYVKAGGTYSDQWTVKDCFAISALLWRDSYTRSAVKCVMNGKLTLQHLIFFTRYIRIQSVLHRKHMKSPVQSPAC
jgi:hypothetical protein